MNTAITDAEFKKSFKTHATAPAPLKTDPEDIVKEYVKTIKTTLSHIKDLGIGQQGTKETKGNLAEAFVKRWMSTKYASVDLSFTTKPWYLHFKRSANNVIEIVGDYDNESDIGHVDDDRSLEFVGTINRYFSVSGDLKDLACDFENALDGLNSDTKHLQGFSSTRKLGGMRAVNLSINATIPDGMCEKHSEMARDMLGHFYLGRALCYKHGVDLYKDLDVGYNHKNAFEVIWAPNVEFLAIRATAPRPIGDPAIVANFFGENYLIDFYDTPNERKISNLIREFSTGNLSGLNDKRKKRNK